MTEDLLLAPATAALCRSCARASLCLGPPHLASPRLTSPFVILSDQNMLGLTSYCSASCHVIPCHACCSVGVGEGPSYTMRPRVVPAVEEGPGPGAYDSAKDVPLGAY